MGTKKRTESTIVNLNCVYVQTNSGINRVCWSPDGGALAWAGGQGIVSVCNIRGGDLAFSDVNDTVQSLAWSPTGKTLAVGTNNSKVVLLDPYRVKLLGEIRAHSYWILDVAWSPDSKFLAYGAYDHRVHVWNVKTKERHWSGEQQSSVFRVAWAPDGKLLASATEDGSITVWESKTGSKVSILEGYGHRVRSLLWSPDGRVLASGAEDNTIRLWDTDSWMLRHKLEGHHSPISNMDWHRTGNFLASVSEDGDIRIWRCDSWETIKILDVDEKHFVPFDISFQEKDQLQNHLNAEKIGVKSWQLNINDLLNAVPTLSTIHYTSAKIVLVGESNVGKSCLALRLAEDRYEELGTTHGMRTLTLTPEQLDPESLTPSNEKRDIVVWDMGGQDEYRLVHQLFIHDTTLALILMDPTRGRTAFEEVEGWSLRLEKQLRDRETIKLLVGTKLDAEKFTIDRTRLNNLVTRCGIDKYFSTSARTGRGISELRQAITKALKWEMLAKTSRPALFQQIRDEIQNKQKNGDLVVLFSELLKELFEGEPDDFDLKSVNAVVDQLAVQGVITDTRLGSGNAY